MIKDLKTKKFYLNKLKLHFKDIEYLKGLLNQEDLSNKRIGDKTIHKIVEERLKMNYNEIKKLKKELI